MHKRLRYCDLLDGGVVRNRVTLGNWIKKYDFPTGQLTGPNTRTWSEDEVAAWLATRPIKPKPTPKSKGRPKADHAGTEA